MSVTIINLSAYANATFRARMQLPQDVIDAVGTDDLSKIVMTVQGRAHPGDTGSPLITFAASAVGDDGEFHISAAQTDLAPVVSAGLIYFDALAALPDGELVVTHSGMFNVTPGVTIVGPGTGSGAIDLSTGDALNTTV